MSLSTKDKDVDLAKWNYVPRSPHEMTEDKPYAAMCLFDAMNEYRTSLGLPPVRYSRALSYVALVHSWDFMENIGGRAPEGGNLHSWSGKIGSGVVYSPDHKHIASVWRKPKELGTGYDSAGYEISAMFCSTSFWSDPKSLAEYFIERWKSSQPHHDCMINKGIWETPYQAAGAGWYVKNSDGYACVWFGHGHDKL